MFARKPFDRALLGRTLCVPTVMRAMMIVVAIFTVGRGALTPPCKRSAHCCKRRIPSDRARASLAILRMKPLPTVNWRVQSHRLTATRLPTRPVVDSLPLRRKPRWLKQPTGLFLRADAPFRARA